MVGADAAVHVMRGFACAREAHAGHRLGRGDCQRRVVMARVELPQGLIGRQPHGVRVVVGVDDAVLDALEGADGDAKGDSGAAVFDGHVGGPPGAPGHVGAQHGGGAVDGPVDGRPGAALVADHR